MWAEADASRFVFQPWTPGAADINPGAVATPPNVGCSFLPLPSEHLRQADLLLLLLPEIEKCSLALLPFENIKITQGRSYFQRAEATLAQEESAKSWLIFFFLKWYNENKYQTYPPGLCVWMLGETWMRWGREKAERDAYVENKKALSVARDWFYFYFSFLTYWRRNKPYHVPRHASLS